MQQGATLNHAVHFPAILTPRRGNHATDRPVAFALTTIPPIFCSSLSVHALILILDRGTIDRDDGLVVVMVTQRCLDPLARPESASVRLKPTLRRRGKEMEIRYPYKRRP